MELGYLLQIGESGLGGVKSIGMPLGLAKTACGIGTVFSYTHDWSQKNAKRVGLVLGLPDFAALALDTLELARSLRLPEIQAARVSELALSILKKSCDLLQWLAQYRFLALEPQVLRGLEGASILSDLTSASASLWQDLGPTPPPTDRDLFVSISKVLKSSLLLYVYVADDQRVKVVATGIGIVGDGYSLYQRCRTMSPRTWTITQAHVYQIISSISLAALAYYGFEKGLFSENLR